MKITKNNYENYFLDYYEGNLQAFEIAELMLFLEQNPDLKVEFDTFEIIPLTDDESILFNEKNQLKKNSSEKIISENDFVDYIENLSSAKQKENFSSQISQNESLKRELNLFEKTILQADETIVFENKKSLKRNEKSIVANYYKYVPVAASLALLIGVGITFLLPKTHTHFAVNAPQKTINNSAPINPIVEIKKEPKANPKKEIVAEKSFSKRQSTPLNLPKSIKEKPTNDTLIQQTALKLKSPENIISPAVPSISKNNISDSLKKINAPSNSAIAFVKKVKPDTNSITLKQMVAAEIKSKIYGDTIANKNKISLKNLVRLGFKGVQKATNNKVKLKEKINNEGDVTAYTVTAGIFGFSHTSKK